MEACQGLYMHMYNNHIGTVQSVFSYKSTVMSDTLTYISTSSVIADCFPKSTVTLDVESINGRFIMLFQRRLICVNWPLFSSMLKVSAQSPSLCYLSVVNQKP